MVDAQPLATGGTIDEAGQKATSIQGIKVVLYIGILNCGCGQELYSRKPSPELLGDDTMIMLICRISFCHDVLDVVFNLLLHNGSMDSSEIQGSLDNCLLKVWTCTDWASLQIPHIGQKEINHLLAHQSSTQTFFVLFHIAVGSALSTSRHENAHRFWLRICWHVAVAA